MRDVMSGDMWIPYVPPFPDNLWLRLSHFTTPYFVCSSNVSESDRAYADALNHKWKWCAEFGRDLLVVEHDMWPTQEDVDAMVSCQDLYCAAPYWTGGRHTIGLGFTRFRSELMGKYPNLVDEAIKIPVPSDGIDVEGHWRRLDTRVERQLLLRGIVPCKHQPVEHKHRYPMPDPIEW